MDLESNGLRQAIPAQDIPPKLRPTTNKPDYETSEESSKNLYNNKRLAHEPVEVGRHF